MAGAQNDLSVAERRRLREQQRREAEASRTVGVPKADAAARPEVPIDELANNPRNAREKLEDLEELAQTYAESGILQPLVVIPTDVFKAAFPESAEDLGAQRYVVIGGNRRLAAARIAGLDKLPVLVNTMATTRKAILVAAATENIARLELKPLEELETIEDLKAELGTYGAVANALGKSEGWVSQRRRLHNLQPEVRQALAERTDGMTVELARDLGKIKDRDEQLAAWKAQQARTAASAAVPKRAGKKKPDAKKAAKVTVPKQGSSSGGGEVDPELKARREACAAAVVAFEGDASRLHIIALQSSTDTAEAVALATQWLSEAGIGASALSLPALTGDEGHERQARAALALSLAHCELRLTRPGAEEPAHTRAYLDWLGTHADYQAADSSESARRA